MSQHRYIKLHVARSGTEFLLARDKDQFSVTLTVNSNMEVNVNIFLLVSQNSFVSLSIDVAGPHLVTKFLDKKLL